MPKCFTWVHYGSLTEIDGEIGAGEQIYSSSVWAMLILVLLLISFNFEIVNT